MIMSFSAYKYKYELHESVYRLDVLGYKYAFNYFIAIRMDFVVIKRVYILFILRFNYSNNLQASFMLKYFE